MTDLNDPLIEKFGMAQVYLGSVYMENFSDKSTVTQNFLVSSFSSYAEAIGKVYLKASEIYSPSGYTIIYVNMPEYLVWTEKSSIEQIKPYDMMVVN